MLVGGLVVAIIALMISLSQSFVIGKIADKSGSWATNIEEVVRDVTDDLEKEFGNKEVTIRINNDDETVEIKASTKTDELKDKLEELEETADTVKAKPEGETPEEK